MRTRRSAILGFLLLLILLPACKRESTAPVAPKPTSEIGGTLRQAIGNDVVTLDPSKLIEASVSTAILYNIYDTLIELDENLRPTPALAESWKVSDDGKVWTFQIRKGVVFHDDPVFPNGKGRELTAEDVVYNFKRVLDAKGGSAGSWILSDVVAGGDQFAAGKTDGFKGIRATDPHTVVIELQRPYLNFLDRLYAPFLCIVPPEAVEKHGDQFGQHPVGTGPFALDSISPSVEVRLKKNPHYWKTDTAGMRLPYLDAVVFRIIKDTSVAFLEFEKGTLDVIDLPVTLAGRVLTADGKVSPQYQKYQSRSVAVLDTQFYAFNMQSPPFRNNRALRQALNYAVNADQIVKVILKDQGVPARGILPPPLVSWKQQGYGYDPAKARALLAQAGYPDGRGLPEITLLVDADEVREAIAATVQSQLAAIGVKMRINKTQFSTLLAEVSSGKHAFFRMWWELPYPDPGAFYFQFLSNLWPPKGYNFGRYSNPDVDRLYNEAIVATNPERQRELWEKLDRTLTEDAPWIFLYHSKKTKLMQPGVEGYPVTPVQIQELERVRLTAPAAKS